MQNGWYRSFHSERSVDRLGRPVPWYTYPCTSFLETRITRSVRVFEYGAGMSSLWYAERVREVVSVEHDSVWADLVGQEAPANCSVVFASDDDAYVHAGTDFEPSNIVVVTSILYRLNTCLGI